MPLGSLPRRPVPGSALALALALNGCGLVPNGRGPEPKPPTIAAPRPRVNPGPLPQLPPPIARASAPSPEFLIPPVAPSRSEHVGDSTPSVAATAVIPAAPGPAPTAPPPPEPVTVTPLEDEEPADKGTARESAPIADAPEPNTDNPAPEPPVDEDVTLVSVSLPPTPAETWRTGVERLRALARDRAEGDGAEARVWDVRERLLAWMEEEPPGEIDVEAPLNALSELAPPAAKPAVEEPESEEADTPLTIAELQICSRVAGFGDFEPLEPAAIGRGLPALVYCELDGVSSVPQGDRFVSRLASTAHLRPVSGGEPVWSRELGVAEDSCRRRRRDYYVNSRLVLPADLPPGDYLLEMALEDLVSGRKASRSIPITVRD